MITSGFTNAPVSQFLVFGVVIGAIVASLTDTRYYIHIQVVPHIWKYGQFWRFLTWQVRRLKITLGCMRSTDARRSCASQTPQRCCSQPSAFTTCASSSASGAVASSP